MPRGISAYQTLKSLTEYSSDNFQSRFDERLLAAGDTATNLTLIGGDASAANVTLNGTTSLTGTLATLLAALFSPSYRAPVYYAADYGVVANPTGIVDDVAHDQSAALQAAINAMPATGAELRLPGGNILLKSGVTVAGPRITLTSADNQFVAQLIASSTFLAGDLLTITGAYSGVDGVTFDVAQTPSQAAANVTACRTSGYTINLQNGYGFVTSASIRGPFIGVCLGTYAGSSTVRDVTIENVADGTSYPGSGGIDVNNVGFGPDNFIFNTRMQPNLGASTVYRPSFGVRIQNSGATEVTNCDFTGMMEAMILVPGNGQKVEATVSTGNYYDGALLTSFRVDPTGTGYVFDVQSDNDWFTSAGTNSNGIVVAGAHSSGSGRPYPVMSCLFSNALIGRNTGQTGNGLLIADAFSSGVRLADSQVFGFYYGASIAAGASRVQILDNAIGAEGFFDLPAGATDSSSRTNYVGINVAAGAGDWIDIHGNRLAGNTSAALAFAATGTHNRVQDNPGYNPVGPSAITPGASPWTFTAGPTEVDLYVNGGTVSSVTVGGITLCSASPCRVTLEPYQAAIVTYSAAPTAAQSVH